MHDPASGQLLTGTLMDYAVPRADIIPNIAVDFSPVPSKSNPLGVKGVGEGGTVAATPTVMNAILDALAPLGRRRRADARDAASACGRRSRRRAPPSARPPPPPAGKRGEGRLRA